MDNNIIDNNINNNLIEYPIDQKLEDADQSPFDSLPEEIALKIFSYLNFATLGTICLVSKDWKRVARDPSL